MYGLSSHGAANREASLLGAENMNVNQIFNGNKLDRDKASYKEWKDNLKVQAANKQVLSMIEGSFKMPSLEAFSGSNEAKELKLSQHKDQIETKLTLAIGLLKESVVPGGKASNIIKQFIVQRDVKGALEALEKAFGKPDIPTVQEMFRRFKKAEQGAKTSNVIVERIETLNSLKAMFPEMRLPTIVEVIMLTQASLGSKENDEILKEAIAELMKLSDDTSITFRSLFESIDQVESIRKMDSNSSIQESKVVAVNMQAQQKMNYKKALTGNIDQVWVENPCPHHPKRLSHTESHTIEECKVEKRIQAKTGAARDNGKSKNQKQATNRAGKQIMMAIENKKRKETHSEDDESNTQINHQNENKIKSSTGVGGEMKSGKWIFREDDEPSDLFQLQGENIIRVSRTGNSYQNSFFENNAKFPKIVYETFMMSENGDSLTEKQVFPKIISSQQDVKTNSNKNNDAIKIEKLSNNKNQFLPNSSEILITGKIENKRQDVFMINTSGKHENIGPERKLYNVYWKNNQPTYVEAEEKTPSSDILHDSGTDMNAVNSMHAYLVEDFVREPHDIMCGTGVVENFIEGYGYIWFLGERFRCNVATRLAKSVISVGLVARKNITSMFHAKGLTIMCKFGRIDYPLNNSNIYMLNPEWFKSEVSITTTGTTESSAKSSTVMIADAVVKDRVMLLHQRLGHTCSKRLIAMAKNDAYKQRGVVLSENEIKDAVTKFCIVCAQAKSTTKKKVGRVNHFEPRRGEQYHVDITGPNSVPSIHGFRYMYLIAEYVTGMMWCYHTERNDDDTTETVIITFEKERLMGKDLPDGTKYLVSDNGEMNTSKIKGLCRKNGYINVFVPSYHSEINGFVEIRIKIVKVMSKALLLQARASEPYFEYSDKHSVFIITILPPCDPKSSRKDPYSEWYGRSYDYTLLRIWGSVAIANIPNPPKNRMPPGVKGVFVGVKDREYQIYIPENDYIIETADVTFFERVDNQDDTIAKIIQSATKWAPNDGIETVSEQLEFQIEDFSRYVNTLHWDDEDRMHYLVIDIRKYRGSIVADRLACVAGVKEAKDCIYAAHLLSFKIISDSQVIFSIMERCPVIKLKIDNLRSQELSNSEAKADEIFIQDEINKKTLRKLSNPSDTKRKAESDRGQKSSEEEPVVETEIIQSAITQNGEALNKSQKTEVEPQFRRKERQFKYLVHSDDSSDTKLSAKSDRIVRTAVEGEPVVETEIIQSAKTQNGEAHKKTQKLLISKVDKTTRIKPSWRYVDEGEEKEATKCDVPKSEREMRMEKKALAREKPLLSKIFTLFLAIGTYAMNIVVPKSHGQAVKSPQAKEWLEAESKEIQSLWDVGAWAWEKLPWGRKPIHSKWAYALKTNADGIVERFKARICARGDMTEQGIDYEETFSPVAKWESIRLFLALTVLLSLIPLQLDVDLAYLYAPLDEAIYMVPPEGMSHPSGMLLRLLQSLYGLPQAGRNWNTHLHRTLLSMGFRRLDEDTCLYVRIITGMITIIAIYVDDLYIAASNKNVLDVFIRNLQKVYKIKILGIPQQLLGVKISWGIKLETVYISIPKMIIQLAEKYEQTTGRKASVPINPGHNLSKNDCPEAEQVKNMNKQEKEAMTYMQKCYRNLVGSYIWICHTCRPDIMYVTMILCMYMSNPGRKHWETALQTLRYLYGTAKLGIRYSKNGEYYAVRICRF